MIHGGLEVLWMFLRFKAGHILAAALEEHGLHEVLSSVDPKRSLWSWSRPFDVLGDLVWDINNNSRIFSSKRF